MNRLKQRLQYVKYVIGNNNLRCIKKCMALLTNNKKKKVKYTKYRIKGIQYYFFARKKIFFLTFCLLPCFSDASVIKCCKNANWMFIECLLNIYEYLLNVYRRCVAYFFFFFNKRQAHVQMSIGYTMTWCFFSFLRSQKKYFGDLKIKL